MHVMSQRSPICIVKYFFKEGLYFNDILSHTSGSIKWSVHLNSLLTSVYFSFPTLCAACLPNFMLLDLVILITCDAENTILKLLIMQLSVGVCSLVQISVLYSTSSHTTLTLAGVRDQLHKRPITQKTSYTRDQLHKRPITQETNYTKDKLHKRPITQETSYTRDQLHKRPITQEANYTKDQLHKRPITQETNYTRDQLHKRPITQETNYSPIQNESKGKIRISYILIFRFLDLRM